MFKGKVALEAIKGEQTLVELGGYNALEILKRDEKSRPTRQSSGRLTAAADFVVIFLYK